VKRRGEEKKTEEPTVQLFGPSIIIYASPSGEGSRSRKKEGKRKKKKPQKKKEKKRNRGEFGRNMRLSSYLFHPILFQLARKGEREEKKNLPKKKGKDKERPNRPLCVSHAPSGSERSRIADRPATEKPSKIQGGKGAQKKKKTGGERFVFFPVDVGVCSNFHSSMTDRRGRSEKGKGRRGGGFEKKGEEREGKERSFRSFYSLCQNTPPFSGPFRGSCVPY